MSVSGIDRLHLITVTGHGHGGVGEVKRGEDGSGGGGGGEYGSVRQHKTYIFHNLHFCDRPHPSANISTLHTGTWSWKDCHQYGWH